MQQWSTVSPSSPRVLPRSQRAVRSGQVGVLGAALLVAFGAVSAGCSVRPVDDVVTLTFMQNKTEASVVAYYDELISEFEAANPDIRVIQNNTEDNFVPALVRGSPPDVTTRSWAFTSGEFAGREVFSDLSGLDAAQAIDPDVQALVEEWDRLDSDATAALPFSLTASGVLYNKQIFEQNGVDIPETWSEFVAVCETLTAAGVVPIYGTYKDPWTIGQGVFDYAAGGLIDTAAFYEDLHSAGGDFGPDSPSTFSNTFADALPKMEFLLANAQPNAASRGYSEGNAAFAAGGAAMYLQGPWALAELTKFDPALQVGSFVLPVTEDPEDRRARVNVDVAVSIPAATKHPDEAKRFVEFLFDPKIVADFNAVNAGFSTLRDTPANTDRRIAELGEYVESGDYYQGPSTYPSPAIPVLNYVQAFAFGGSGSDMLTRLDDDWRRVAERNAARGAGK
ncbi:MAG: ABC transporter substrate-binding protein [Rhodococcus sp. (in: high G+C Gram-positive bacteria)]